MQKETKQCNECHFDLGYNQGCKLGYKNNIECVKQSASTIKLESNCVYREMCCDIKNHQNEIKSLQIENEKLREQVMDYELCLERSRKNIDRYYGELVAESRFDIDETLSKYKVGER